MPTQGSRRHLLALLLACGCGEGPTPESSGPAASNESWLTTIRDRIAAESRAIHPADGAFAAAVPSLGLAARFDAEGVTILDPSGSEILGLHTVEWGRDGDLRLVQTGAGTLGACLPDRDAMGRCVRQLEYVDGALTEWWIGLDNGLQQGWTIDEAPLGSGAIVIAVAIDAAVLAAAADDDDANGEIVRMTDATGRDWRVGEVAAWDAMGRSLPAALSSDGDQLRVRVDDAGAAYPITIDPVYTTEAWSVTGAPSDAPIGAEIAGAGDVNGDGYNDVLVSASPASGYGAYVYYGSVTGAAETASGEFGLPGVTVMTGVGDIDADGYDDVLIGEPSYATNTGRFFIHYGSSTGLPAAASGTRVGVDGIYNFLGCSIDGAGDVNADGYADVIVGEYGYNHYTGRAYVYLGSASGLSATPDTALDGTAWADNIGRYVAGAGDVDGDGYDDVMIGSTHINEVYVYVGGPSGTSAAVATTLTGPTGESFGRVAGAGDVNADGHDDVLVGAQAYGTSTGRVYVYLGARGGLTTSIAATLQGEAVQNQFGATLAGPGDVNGDGYDDVVVGAYAYATNTGRVYIYTGSATGVSTTATTTLTGETTSDLFGTVIAAAGDVNGDGYADVLTSATTYRSSMGRVYLYMGEAGGLTDPAASSWTGVGIEYLGYAVAGAGDVNGDTFDDVLVGAYRVEGSTGQAYLYAGSATGLTTDAAVTFEGESGNGDFGRAVAGAGDVNGDGYDDVIIGAQRYPLTGAYGRAYVYLGAASWPSTTASTTLTGTASGDYFGCDVAGAGDVDGDGYDDVLVGAYAYSRYLGGAFLYMGSATGLTATPAVVLSGSASSRFGESLDGAGDVNGDGYHDVVIGAYYDGYGYGRIALYLGAASGLSTTPDMAVSGTTASMRLGSTVAGAGDVDGDGYDDVLVGSDGGAGAAYVYTGSATGVSSTPRTTLTGLLSHDYASAVAAAGDVNGDGYADVLVSAAYGTVRIAGEVYLYEGGPAGTPTTATATLTGEVSGDYFGAAIDGAGDVDGDGYDDVIVGAPLHGDYAGKAYVYLGEPTDLDFDGILATEDCDDTDVSVGAATTRYADDDGDGYGTTAATAEVCAGVAGWAAAATDCDDTDGAIHPDGSEVCDALGVDEDCDGLTDDDDVGTTGQSTFYADRDGDGYGGAATLLACDAHAGTFATSDDCDDRDATVNPAASEVCDATDTDEDCDGLADDADPSATGLTTVYADVDGDGAGGTIATLACEARAGFLLSATDCDDADAAITPDATEVCDAAHVDEDCDGLADDADASASGRTTYYADADGDGFGDAAVTSYACDAPAGTGADATDCDDTDAAAHPGATETPGDERDQDCDGGEQCLIDADEDGYRPDASTLASIDSDCADAGEAMAAEPDGDCDDANASVSPGATEVVADGIDQDCDGGEVCYADADTDGARADSVVTSTDADCTDATEALASSPADCADTDGAIAPTATEIAGNEIDEDCDGGELCFIDADGDGYRTDGAAIVPSPDALCDAPGEARSSALESDCDDADADFHPGAAEVDCADPLDYNCDGSTGFADADADGWAACEECDDADGSVNPVATELPGDGVDGDCDGADICYVDADDDNYRPDDSTTPGGTIGCASAGEALASQGIGDCDDSDASVHPAAAETTGDERDSDCNGNEVCYADPDGDGYRPAALATIASADLDCDDAAEADAGAGDGDCDEGNASIHPGAVDIPDDGIDQDCDGADGRSEPTSDDGTDSGGDSGDAAEAPSGAGGAKTPPAGNCGCASPGAGASLVPCLLAALGLRRRRRRRA